PVHSTSWCEILPTYPRLPCAVAARLADPQAKGNPPRPGGTATGGSGRGVECPHGKSTAALVISMAANSLAHPKEALDAGAEEDDAEGGSVSCRASLRGGAVARFDRLGRLRGPRHTESACLSGPTVRRQHQRSADHYSGHGSLSS